MNDTKANDEGVDDCDDENDDHNGVVDNFCIVFMFFIIDVETCKDEKENTNHNLENYAAHYQNYKRSEVLMDVTNLQDILELCGISSEQSYVQHALGQGLLGGVVVGVQAALCLFFSLKSHIWYSGHFPHNCWASGEVSCIVLKLEGIVIGKLFMQQVSLKSINFIFPLLHPPQCHLPM